MNNSKENSKTSKKLENYMYKEYTKREYIEARSLLSMVLIQI